MYSQNALETFILFDMKGIIFWSMQNGNIFIEVFIVFLSKSASIFNF